MKQRDLKAEVFHMAVMYYGAGMLHRLRLMTFDERKAVLHEAGEISARDPMYMCPSPTFIVPSWSAKKLTGGQVTALLVYGLWVQVGEDEGIASGLISDWPEIKLACALAAQPSQSELNGRLGTHTEQKPEMAQEAAG